MTDHLVRRRSSRRVSSKAKRIYNVGDLVEIVNQIDTNGSAASVATGYLISKLTNDSAVLHRWRVGCLPDDESKPPQDLDESQLGEILGQQPPPPAAKHHNTPAATTTTTRTTKAVTRKSKGSSKKQPPTPPPPPPPPRVVASAAVTPETRSSNNSSPTSSTASTAAAGGSLSPLHTTTITKLSSPDESDHPNKHSAKSAREERSKRRHAQQSPLRPPLAKKAKVANNHHKSGLKQPVEVVQIPFKTGILYLYRGAHRRAEFVRKI